MNFTDKKTSIELAILFQNSEFVWLDIESHKPVLREFAVKNNNPILAPAVTCEELGEWITNNDPGRGDSYHVLRNNNPSTGWHLCVWTSIASCKKIDGYEGTYTVSTYNAGHFKAPNETQARAEAIKLILEGMR